jgi:hypothetical protein
MRRSTRQAFENVPGSGSSARASIGDVHVSFAITELAKTQQATVALMTNYETSLEDTLGMLFDPGTLQKLRAVQGMVTTHNIKQYALDQRGTYLHLDYAGATVPAIDAIMMNPQISVEPLMTFVSAVKAIHDRFEEAKAVLRWLNRNATPGAIRYYWPSAMKLCPNSPIWADLQSVPSRYDTPAGIAHWTQAIKDSATTVTSALMLPSGTAPKARRGIGAMWLRFETTKVHLTGAQEYDTDTMLYNI